MKQLFIIILLTFFCESSKSQTKTSFKITPIEFDSLVTFSFNIPNSFNISITIIDSLNKEVVSVVPIKYFKAGKHDTIVDLSKLSPSKYYAVFLENVKKIDNNKVSFFQVHQNLLIRKSTKK